MSSFLSLPLSLPPPVQEPLNRSVSSFPREKALFISDWFVWCCFFFLFLPQKKFAVPEEEGGGGGGRGN